MNPENQNPNDVLTFWREAGPKKWFKKDDDFDVAIGQRFGPLLDKAIDGDLDHWTEEPDSALALILVLDQFSRNLFRDDVRAFAQDEKSIGIVNDMMASGMDRKTPEDLQPFVYMPLMHSENLADQEKCIAEMERIDQPENVKFAVIHRDIIKKFGRFPHRNAILGRKTTPEEQEFLDEGGFSG